MHPFIFNTPADCASDNDRPACNLVGCGGGGKLAAVILCCILCIKLARGKIYFLFLFYEEKIENRASDCSVPRKYRQASVLDGKLWCKSRHFPSLILCTSYCLWEAFCEAHITAH